MSREIDEEVLRLVLETDQFQRAANQSIDTIESLNRSLGSMNDQEILDVSSLKRGVTHVRAFSGEVVDACQEACKKISVTQIMGITSIENLTNSAINSLKGIIKSSTLDQVTAGFNKFGEKTKSVGTLVSQGYDLETVNETVDKLRWFTDETSYNLLSMVETMGKFTATGMSLEEATDSVQGIALWAAKAGQNSQKASQAMYQLAQAMGRGVIRNEDWKSIQNYSMDNVEFRQKAIDAAILRGELTKIGDDLYSMKNSKMQLNMSGLFSSDGLTSGAWFTKEVFIDTLRTYNAVTDQIRQFQEAYEEVSGEAITASEAMRMLNGRVDDFGLSSMKAAQEARTFGDMIDATKDAVSSQWMQIYEYIFGDYEQATRLWTDLSEVLWNTFAGPLYDLNVEVLEPWSKGIEDLFDGASGRDMFIEALWNMFDIIGLLIEPLKELWEVIFPPATAEGLLTFTHKLLRLTEMVKTALSPAVELAEEAADVAGDMVQKALDMIKPVTAVTDAAAEAGEVVETVVESLGGLDDIAKRVIGGEFGNGSVRFEALEELGHNYKVVQNRVNEMLGCNFRYQVSEEELAEAMKAYGQNTEEAVDATEEMAATEETTSKRAQHLQDALMLVGRAYKLLLSTITFAAKGIRKAIELAAKLVSWLIDKLLESASMLYNSGFMDVLEETAGIIEDTIKGIYSLLSKSLPKIFGLVNSVLGGAFYTVTKVFGELFKAIKSSLESTKALDKLKSAFTSLWNTGKKVFSGLGGSIRKAFESFANSKFAGYLDTLISKAKEIGEKIGSALGKAIEKVSEYAEKAQKYLGEWWSGFDSSGVILEAFQKAVNFVGDAIAFVHEKMKNLVDGISKWLKEHSVVSGVLDTVSKAITLVGKGIEWLYTNVSKFIKDVVEKLAHDVRVQKLISDIQELGQSIMDLATQLGMLIFGGVGSLMQTLGTSLGIVLPVSADYDPELEALAGNIEGGAIQLQYESVDGTEMPGMPGIPGIDTEATGTLMNQVDAHASIVNIFTESIGKLADGMHQAVQWLIDRTEDVKKFFDIFNKDASDRITLMFQAISDTGEKLKQTNVGEFIKKMADAASKFGEMFTDVKNHVQFFTDFWAKLKKPFSWITDMLDKFFGKMKDMSSEVNWADIIDKLFGAATLWTVNKGLDSLQKIGEALLYIPTWLDSIVKGFNAVQWSKSAEAASKSILNIAAAVIIIVGALMLVTFMVNAYEDDFFVALGAIAVIIWLVSKYYQALAAMKNATANVTKAQAAEKQVEADAKATDNLISALKNSVDTYIFAPIKNLVAGLGTTLDKYITRLTLPPIMNAVTGLILAIGAVIGGIWWVTKDMDMGEFGEFVKKIAAVLAVMAVFLFVVLQMIKGVTKAVSKEKINFSSFLVILGVVYAIGKMLVVLKTIWDYAGALYDQFLTKPQDTIAKLAGFFAAFVVFLGILAVIVGFITKINESLGAITEATDAADKKKGSDKEAMEKIGKIWTMIKIMIGIGIFIKMIVSAIKDLTNVIAPIDWKGNVADKWTVLKRAIAAILAVVAMWFIMRQMVDSVSKIGKLDEGQDTVGFFTLIGVAIIMLVMLSAVGNIISQLNKMTKKMSGKEALAKLSAAAIFVGSLGLFIKAITDVASKISADKGSLLKMVASFLIMGGIMYVLTILVETISGAKIDVVGVLKFVAAMAIVVAACMALLFVISKIESMFKSRGGSLFDALAIMVGSVAAITASILMLAGAVAVISSLKTSFTQVLKVLGIMGIVIAAMIGIAALLAGLDKWMGGKGALLANLFQMAAAFLMISAAILALSVAIGILGYALPAFINGLAQVGTLVEQNKDAIIKGAMVLGILLAIGLLAAFVFVKAKAAGGLIKMFAGMFAHAKDFVAKHKGIAEIGKIIVTKVEQLSTLFQKLAPFFQKHIIITVLTLALILAGVIEAVAPGVADALFRGIIAILNGAAVALEEHGNELLKAVGRIASAIFNVLLEALQDLFNSWSVTQWIGENLHIGDALNKAVDHVQSWFPVNEKFIQDEDVREQHKDNLRTYNKDTREWEQADVQKTTTVKVSTKVDVDTSDPSNQPSHIAKKATSIIDPNIDDGMAMAQQQIDQKGPAVVTTPAPQLQIDTSGADANSQSLLGQMAGYVKNATSSISGTGEGSLLSNIMGENGMGLNVDIPVDGSFDFTSFDMESITGGEGYDSILTNFGVVGDASGESYVTSVTDTIGSGESSSSVSGSVESVINTAGSNADSVAKTRGYSAGGYMVDGIIRGLDSKRGDAIYAAGSLAGQIASTMERRLQINSPSKVTDRIGVFAGLGLIDALKRMTPTVGLTASLMADSVIDGVANASTASATPTIRPIIDTTSYRSGMGSIDKMMYTRTLDIGANIDNANLVNRSIVDELKTSRFENARLAGELRRMRNDIGLMRTDISSTAKSFASMGVTIDGRKLVGELTPRIDRELGWISGRRM